MVMPERSFSNEKYRWGFNEKETDNETKWQDYGFRIYYPGLGKFLSVDPLTQHYPELTTYQFASNSPISGIDLDGKEYLYAHEARIEVVSGMVKLKRQNLHNVTNSAINAYNENPKNWKQNEIGVSAEIALVNAYQQKLNDFWSGGAQMQDSPDDPSTNPSGTVNITSPKGKPQSTVNTSNALKTTRANGAASLLDQIGKGLNWIALAFVQDDKNKYESHMGLYTKAMDNVNTAINKGWIDDKHMNKGDLSAIINVVLQGDNPSKDEYNYKLGMKIVREIAKNEKGPNVTTNSGNPMPPNSEGRKKAE